VTGARILLVRFGAIGDILLTTPLVRALRNRHPFAQIDFATKERYAPLISANPRLSGVLTLEGHGGMTGLAAELRRRRYSHRLDLQGNFRSMVLQALVPGRWSGYDKRRTARALLIQTKERGRAETRPVAERYFEAARDLDVTPDGEPPDFYLSEESEARAAEKLAALGRLSAGLAHELRNPLNTLSVLTYAMTEQAQSNGLHVADLEVVRSEIARLGLLIDQFLDFARPRPPRFERQRLEEVLEETLLLIGPEAGKKGIRLERAWSETPAVWGDGDQLKQVFLNLMLNAVQALECGGRLAARTRLATGGVVVEIHDTGPGIAPEMLERLFEPFVTTRPGGTGLGLPISLRIIEGHSGKLRLDSLPGEGTTAIVWLPV